MPNTDKMQWPYPNQDADPWFDVFESMIDGIDASGYSSREDRSIIFGGGGNVSWNSSTGVLSWASDFVLYSLIAGYKLTIPAGNITIANNQVLYLVVTRSPTQNLTLTFSVASNVPNTDQAMAFAIRVGSIVYFRWGKKIENGETINLFAGGGGGGSGSDVYERSATFGVPIGAYTDEATLGRIIANGSLIGISAEAAIPVTAGTITVNAKINGVIALTVVLSVADPSVAQTTVAPGALPLSSSDQISVEVIAVGHTNGSMVAAGLTVNVIMASGVSLPLPSIPDASTTVKGVTRLSVAPAVAITPIAVGDNDPRVSQNRRIVYTVSQPADGSDFNVPISPSMPSTSYIVTHSLATVASHVMLSVPTGGRATNQFNVKTSAALLNGETIYFHVVEI